MSGLTSALRIPLILHVGVPSTALASANNNWTLGLHASSGLGALGDQVSEVRLQPMAGFLENLMIRTTQAAGSSARFVIYINGVATTLDTVSVAGTGAAVTTTITPAVPVAIAAGDLVQLCAVITGIGACTLYAATAIIRPTI